MFPPFSRSLCLGTQGRTRGWFCWEDGDLPGQAHDHPAGELRSTEAVPIGGANDGRRKETSVGPDPTFPFLSGQKPPPYASHLGSPMDTCPNPRAGGKTPTLALCCHAEGLQLGKNSRPLSPSSLLPRQRSASLDWEIHVWLSISFSSCFRIHLPMGNTDSRCSEPSLVLRPRPRWVSKPIKFRSAHCPHTFIKLPSLGSVSNKARIFISTCLTSPPTSQQVLKRESFLTPYRTGPC